MRLQILFSLLLIFNLYSESFAQDSVFVKARTFAIAGDREKAREICYNHLFKYPDDNDYRLLVARSFAWDKEFEKARTELNKIFAIDTTNLEAWSLKIDVETWDENFEKSLQVCDSALVHFPSSIELKSKKARLLYRIDQEKAYDLVQQILSNDPNNKIAQKLRGQLAKESNHPELSVKHFWTRVSEPGDFDRHISSVEYKAKNTYGSLVTSVSIGDFVISDENLWSSNLSEEYKLELYPILSDYNYLYLNYAYGEGDMFANHRYGVEFFQIISHFEVSSGYRFLDFDQDNVNIFTFSLSQYFKNFLFSARSYLAYKNSNFDQTYLFNTRYFIEGTQHVVEAGVGFGVSPDELNVQTEIERVYNRKNFKFIANYRNKFFNSDFFYKIYIDCDYQEYKFDTYRVLPRFGVELGYRF